jgi:hypothetical protein
MVGIAALHPPYGLDIFIGWVERSDTHQISAEYSTNPDAINPNAT